MNTRKYTIIVVGQSHNVELRYSHCYAKGLLLRRALQQHLLKIENGPKYQNNEGNNTRCSLRMKNS